ncbi:MAG: helix-turn-helix domain-containing protein [Candidatus Omnitrophica bacterium]|nr:helix-turn-helix domain-containing protein [Candidatus Omnitrophota bacterium]
MINIRAYMTVKEVAQRIELTERRIRELIRDKEIRATKIGRWRIAPEDLEAFIRSRTNLPKTYDSLQHS